ncbi:alpha/beta hydrolase [Skermanella rosea]|uniref:alpha/beta fold hydrolase n=1 Tax=Skermanella rosea TaxID=1817965 RepID=UPI001E56E320|nr:alpha/beta hydrolase [Skermanella rosea]UEM01410.1 alpha/beta hydrolase [Skermanella rosea]
MYGYRPPRASRTGTIIAASAAALAAAALFNTWRSRKAEREHPPSGRFVTVDGVRLHYIERGEGTPVVLLHGNIVTAEDYVWSGVFHRLAANHRVISIDRPGFGYSDRPYGPMWTAREQADLLRDAFSELGIDRAVVVGHSWGALVAMELALSHPDAVSGLVLLAGYYQTTVRADVPLVAAPAVPVFGDVLRYTVSPLVGSALMTPTLKAMFAPLPIPELFDREFPRVFPVRPGQIRAEAQDAVTMVPAVYGMEERVRDLHMPVTIVAGTEDRVVDHETHAVWLHDAIPTSDLRLVPGAGHMVHYAAPDEVADAIEQTARADRVAAPRVPGLSAHS